MHTVKYSKFRNIQYVYVNKYASLRATSYIITPVAVQKSKALKSMNVFCKNIITCFS
jgi:hypothetical protein